MNAGRWSPHPIIPELEVINLDKIFWDTFNKIMFQLTRFKMSLKYYCVKLVKCTFILFQMLL